MLLLVHNMWLGSYDLIDSDGIQLVYDSLRVDEDGVGSVVIAGEVIDNIPVTEVGEDYYENV